MMNHLGKIGLIGITVGIVGMAAGAAVDGDHTHRGNVPWEWLTNDYENCDGKSTGDATPERRIAWDGGDSVAINASATVHYRAGEGDEVIVRGRPEAVAHVKVHDGKISVTCRGVSRNDLDITLPGRNFRDVAMNGSGHMTMENIDQPTLNLSIAGSGKVHAQGKSEDVRISLAGSGEAVLTNLTNEKLKISIAGSGDVRASGTGNRADVSIAGSGDVFLGDLQIKTLNVSVAGSGDTEAAPQDTAKVSIMGSGDVKLRTRPAQLDSKIMGSGRVVQPEAEATKNSAT